MALGALLALLLAAGRLDRELGVVRELAVVAFEFDFVLPRLVGAEVARVDDQALFAALHSRGRTW